MPGLKNAGNGQFLRKNDVAQLVDCFFFFAFGVLELLNAVEHLAEVAGRINGDLSPTLTPSFRASSIPRTADSPSRSSLPNLMNFAAESLSLPAEDRCRE